MYPSRVASAQCPMGDAQLLSVPGSVHLPIFSFICLFLFLNALTAQGQKISEAELISYGEKLASVKILNEEGKKRMIETIRDSTIADFTAVEQGLYPSRSSILTFCYLAFLNELSYRSGLTLTPREQRYHLKQIAKANKYAADDPEKYEEIISDLTARGNRLFERHGRERSKIEESIPVEDYVADSWRVLPLFPQPVNIDGRAVHPTRSVMGKTRTRTARDLLNIGLIDDKVYKELMKAIADSSATVEYELFGIAATRTIYYESFPFVKQRQLELVNALVANNLMPYDQKEKLLSSYGAYDLKSTIDIAALCNRTLVVDTLHISRPQKYFSDLINGLARIIPGYRPTNIQVKTDTVVEWEMPARYVKVSLIADSREYRINVFAGIVGDTISLERSAMMYSRETIAFLVNKWLNDQRSPYRLYTVTAGPDSPTETRAVFILMDENERELWRGQEEGLSEADHRDRLTSMDIDRAIATFDSIGLFSHLSRQQIDSSRMTVAEKFIVNHADILISFPNVLYEYYWEMPGIEQPYAEQCRRIAAISRGRFSPTNMQDDFKNQFTRHKREVTFSFLSNGKLYRRTMNVQDDWMDESALELIRQAIREKNPNDNLYRCKNDVYLYLEQSQYDFLNRTFPEIFETH
jgi:hypothetical protein